MVFLNAPEGAVLSGFTITGGNNPDGAMPGGGIAITGSPTIFGNVVTGNYAAAGGGGIGVTYGSPTIESNTISYNTVTLSGAGGCGIELDNAYGYAGARVVGNTIRNNSCPEGSGGGIHLNDAGTPLIMNNVISANQAGEYRPPLVIGVGGGVETENDSNPVLVQNLIINNIANFGGGAYFSVPKGSTGPTLVNNTISGNESDYGYGSAVYASGYDGPSTFYNNLFIDFSGQNPVYCDPNFNPVPPRPIRFRWWIPCWRFSLPC